jgi:ABC-type lipoprotein export system ATPase subunit
MTEGQAGELILLQHLQVQRQGEAILRVPHLQLQAGELLLIEGKAGSGKSSLMSVLYGDLLAGTGIAWVLNFNLLALTPPSAAALRRQLGLILPRFPLLEDYSLAAQFELQLRLQLHLSDEQVGAQIEEAAAFAQIQEILDKPTATFSRREQVLAMLARAVVARPTLIIADDLLAGQSGEEKAFLLDKLQTYATDQKAGVICTVGHSDHQSLPPKARLYQAKTGELRQIK